MSARSFTVTAYLDEGALPVPETLAVARALDATVRTPAARAVHATKVYGHGDTAVVALDDVTVEFATGRFTAIMGPSGSGKSTLMHNLAGLDTLTAGHVLIGDVDLTKLDDKRLTILRRDKVG